jgi:hypothetical protein
VAVPKVASGGLVMVVSVAWGDGAGMLVAVRYDERGVIVGARCACGIMESKVIGGAGNWWESLGLADLTPAIVILLRSELTFRDSLSRASQVPRGQLAYSTDRCPSGSVCFRLTQRAHGAAVLAIEAWLPTAPRRARTPSRPELGTLHQATAAVRRTHTTGVCERRRIAPRRCASRY